MEPLWSPVVATGGNHSQISLTQMARKQAKTVAGGCDQLRKGAHGKGRVEATSLVLKRGSLSRLRNRERRAAPTVTRDEDLDSTFRACGRAAAAASPSRLITCAEQCS
jgi:hypothetical protein